MARAAVASAASAHPVTVGAMATTILVPDDHDDQSAVAFDPAALLVRAGVIADPGAAQHPALQAVLELVRRSMAERTRDSYRRAYGAYAAYAATLGFAPLDAPPEVVAAYLTSRMGVIDDRGYLVTDEDGNPLAGALRPRSAGVHLAAIDKAFSFAGLAQPGKSAIVTLAMSGARNTWGMALLNQRAAIDRELLVRLLGVVGYPEFIRRRHLALLALFAGLPGHVTPGQIARLRFDDDSVVIGTRQVVLFLPPTVRGGGRTEVTLPARPGSPLCPVRSLALLAEACAFTGPVVRAAPRSETPLTRPGVVQAAAQAFRAAGLPNRPEPAAFAAAARNLPAALARPPLLEVRDRAALLAGWWGCRRRSELVALDWEHLEREEEDLALHIARSKTDQEGVGHCVWISPSADPLWPCGVEAVDAWAARVGELLGGNPYADLPHTPVFLVIDRHGRIATDAGGRPRRLSGQAVCELVQRRIAGAGLDPARYGAHSLRAGFITEALTDDKLTLAEAQEISGHKRIDSLVGYHRRANLRVNNPVRRIVFARPAPDPSADAAR